MHTEQVSALFFNLMNRQDLDGLKELLAEGAALYFPKTQPLIGRDRVLKFIGLLFRQYPRLTFQVHRNIVQADIAAVHWSNSGLNRKKEPYENEGITILELSEGKVNFISDFFKDTDKF